LCLDEPNPLETAFEQLGYIDDSPRESVVVSSIYIINYDRLIEQYTKSDPNLAGRRGS
jgi:hypothetical protein